MSPSFTLNYMVTDNEGQKFVTIFLPGMAGRTARDDHPSYEAAVAKLDAATEAVAGQNFSLAAALAQEAYDLIDVEQTIRTRFESLSDRISVRDGKVYVDGDEVGGKLVDHIMAALEAGEDFGPLVSFYEKLLTNPLGHAREALYPWLDNYGLTITDSGNVIGYKTFYSVLDPETGEVKGYRPSRKSNNPDRVNGEEVTVGEYMIVNVGDTVETPRSLVLHEPSTACAEGLHVGNFSYSFGGDAKFAVEFDPRDVVNVPNSEGKLRVCRYTVLELVDQTPIDVPIYHTDSEPYEDVCDEDVCWECGDDLEDCVCDEDDFDEDDRCECGLYVEECLGCTDEDDAEDDEPETWLDGDKPTLAQIEEEIDSLTEAATAIRDAMGRWVSGRPGSQRDNLGRFIG